MKFLSKHLGIIILIVLAVLAVAGIAGGIIADRMTVSYDYADVELIDGKQKLFGESDAQVTVEYEGEWYDLYGLKDITKYSKGQVIRVMQSDDKFYADEEAIKSYSVPGRICYYCMVFGAVVVIIGIVRLSAYLKYRARKKNAQTMQ